MDRETVKLLLEGLGLQIEVLTAILAELGEIRRVLEGQDVEEEGATYLGDTSATFTVPQTLNGPKT